MRKVFIAFLLLGKCCKNWPPAHPRVFKRFQRFYIFQWLFFEKNLPGTRPDQFRYTFSNFNGGGKKAFTLIELMMVVAIIGTLAAIAVPNYMSFKEEAMIAKTIQTMRMVENELIAFQLDKGRYPDSLAEAGLDHLRDPWGRPYQYLNIETSKGKGKRRKKHKTVPLNWDFDLYSMGPDGKSKPPLTAKHSRDDIVRANNGGFLGKASSY